jgi:hypothetical protein
MMMTQSGELRGHFALTPCQRLVGQECPQQVPGTDPRGLLLDGGEQPGLLGQVNRLRRQAGRPGVAGLHPVERSVQVRQQPPGVHFATAQHGGEVAATGIRPRLFNARY